MAVSSEIRLADSADALAKSPFVGSASEAALNADGPSPELADGSTSPGARADFVGVISLIFRTERD
ncbi:MAG: hypothetical protein U1G07_25590 [Verrucomicrobiota bacterium]